MGAEKQQSELVEKQALGHKLGDARLALLGYCRALVKDEAEAEDLVQQVLLAALTRTKLDLTRPLLPWLRRVARNMAIDRYRSRSREDELPEVLRDPSSVAPDAAVEVARQATTAWLSLLGSVKPRARAVLLLRDLLDFSIDETAGLLGISASNVKVTLHRARAALGEAAARDPLTSQAAHTRALGAVFEGLPRRDQYSPRGLLAGGASGEISDTRVESASAWSMWLSLMNAAERAAEGSPAIAVKARLARVLALHPDSSYAFEVDLAEARRLCAEREVPGLHVDVELVAGVAFVQRGRLIEAEQAFAAVLAVSDLSAEVRGYVATGLGGLHWRRGRFAQARDMYEEAGKWVKSEEVRAALVHNMALVDALSGELEASLRRAATALEAHRSAGRAHNAFSALNTMGMALQNFGRLDEASARFNEALAVLVDLGLENKAGAVHNNLGLIAHEQGRLADAVSTCQAVIAMGLESGDRRRVAIANANLGVARHAQGQLVAADRSLTEAIAVADAVGFGHLVGFATAHRAAVRAGLGVDFDGDLQAARQVIEDIGDPRMMEVLTALEAVIALRSADELTVEVVDAIRDTRASLQAGASRFAAVRIARGLLDQTASAVGVGFVG